MAFTNIPLLADNDPADRQWLNAIVSNLNHLNNSGVKVSYSGYGESRDSGMRIASGAIDCTSTNSFHRTRWVQTHNAFTPGTRPVAVVTLASLRARRSTTAIAQRTGESHLLDHTGFQCYARFIFDEGILPFGPNYLNWIMIGY